MQFYKVNAGKKGASGWSNLLASSKETITYAESYGNTLHFVNHITLLLAVKC